MKRGKKEQDPEKDPRQSERGLFKTASERTGLDVVEAMKAFRELISSDMQWANVRKKRYRSRSNVARVTALAFTGISTVILGFDWIDHRAEVALPLVAAVTFLGSLEALNNWRDRWVLLEEAQYRLNRLRDSIDYVLVATPEDELSRGQFRAFFAEQQVIWEDVSRRWVGFRRRAESHLASRHHEGDGST